MVYIPCIMNIKKIPIEEIIFKYKKLKYTINSIAKEYKCSSTTIKKYLIKENVWEKRPAKRKYTLNENYFDIIDTEEKAYFLGLLYADGYNCESGNYVNLELNYKDKEILEKFNKCIGSNKPLMRHKKKGLKHSWRLNLSSKKISRQLKLLGCYQKKSLTLKFPTKEQVPEHLIRHFIRGYMDGDGSFGIYWSKRFNYYRSAFTLTSSLFFCESFANFIKEKFNFNSHTRARFPERKNNNRTLSLSSKKRVFTILKWLYNDSNIFLKRKYNKYNWCRKTLLNSNITNKTRKLLIGQ